MLGYISNGMPKKVLQLFEQMTMKPDPVMITILFNACAKLANEETKQFAVNILKELPKSFLNNQNLVNSALDMLMRFGAVERAEQLFSETKTKNTNSYAIMLNGYNLNDQPFSSLKLFERIQKQMTTIDGPVAVALIAACSQIAMLSTSRRVLQSIPLDLRDNPRVKSALIDMWVRYISFEWITFISGCFSFIVFSRQGKVGAIEEATKIFQTITSSNAFAYTAMSKNRMMILVLCH